MYHACHRTYFELHLLLNVGRDSSNWSIHAYFDNDIVCCVCLRLHVGIFDTPIHLSLETEEMGLVLLLVEDTERLVVLLGVERGLLFATFEARCFPFAAV